MTNLKLFFGWFISQFQRYVLLPFLLGSGDWVGLRTEEGKPYEPKSLKNELRYLEWYLKSYYDSSFSFSHEIFQEHGSVVIALQERVREWRVQPDLVARGYGQLPQRAEGK